MRFSLALTRRTLLLLALAAAAACLVLSDPMPASASSQDCRVRSSWGAQRNCTFLEQYGKCLSSAYSSYDDCLLYSRRASGVRRLGRRAACEAGIQIDLFACHLGLPYYLYQQIRST